LNAFSLHLPPLRERKTDIPLLARHFLHDYSEKYRKMSLKDISPEAEELLVAYRWPGNIRELRNMIERAVALAAGPRIQDYDLLFDEAAADDPVPDEATLDLKTQVEDAERAAILRALDETDGALQSAAALLGVSRKTLWEKMRRYDIDRHE